MNTDSAQRIVLGQINGLFGVRGWLKVFSHTAPRDGILAYPKWLIGRKGEWQHVEVLDGRPQGKGIIVRLAGVDSREQAAEWIGAEIAIARDALPKPRDGSVYWADLVGLKVVNTEGVDFGQVDYLFETGANDVLVVRGERERLIPWISTATSAALENAEVLPATVDPVIVSVDLEQRLLTVDWDADF